MARVLIPLADGCEEMEAVIVADVLRRAGIEVAIAGLKEGIITASRDVHLIPDTLWDEVDTSHYDMIILPGGMGGTQALCEHDGVQTTLGEFAMNKKLIGAICAAALALYKAGILDGRPFTCYPGIEDMMDDSVNRLDDRVVEDGNLITSQGPGTAIEFALKIVERLADAETAAKVAEGMLV
ncbi:DJ-1 family glyoxalase III [Verrucomicrobiota bacterium]